MGKYYFTDQKTISDFSVENIEELYDKGYVFTRLAKGTMNQTRSIRVDLSKFELSSENRRVLKHVEGLGISKSEVPMNFEDYDWEIAKLAKDFYTEKFGSKTFTANKARELLTNPFKSNYNVILKYTLGSEKVGYSIGFETSNIFHYAHPFYYHEKFNNNFGMGMMLLAINKAKEESKKYFYIGSASKPEDKYKFQFKGLEWYDWNTWSTDIEKLKETILPKS